MIDVFEQYLNNYLKFDKQGRSRIPYDLLGIANLSTETDIYFVIATKELRKDNYLFKLVTKKDLKKNDNIIGMRRIDNKGRICFKQFTDVGVFKNCIWVVSKGYLWIRKIECQT